MASLFFLFRKIKFVACLQFSGREVQRSRTKCIEFVWVPPQKKEKWYTLCTDCHSMLAFKYGSLQLILDENFLSDLMLYVMKCSIKLFMWWDVNFLLIYLGLGWNDHAVYMGYVNGAQIGSCACCHVVVHVSIHVVSCHHHFPCHCHVKLHVIIAIHVISMSAATSSAMSSMRDM